MRPKKKLPVRLTIQSRFNDPKFRMFKFYNSTRISLKMDQHLQSKGDIEKQLYMDENEDLFFLFSYINFFQK